MRRRLRGAAGGWIRRTRASRWLLAAVLIAVIVVPLPSPASGQQPAACRTCRTAPRPGGAERWAVRLPGQWAAADGAGGTVPAAGQAYVAVNGETAVVGDGLSMAAYRVADGVPLWQIALDAPAGSKIMSVRAWQGVVTAGVAGSSGTARTETVISTATGTVLGSHPAGLFGGAVAATARATVIVGVGTVTSYDNATGRVIWRRRTAAGPWRADGGTLYVAQQAGGPIGAGPVTGLQVVDLNSGTERIMASPPGHPFPGTLTAAADGAVLFTSAAGVTAYSEWTGSELWSAAGAVPEGSDPVAGLVYLTARDGALTGVDPSTGKAVTSVPGSAATGSAGMYVVRGGVALGLDSGAGGEAWGYSAAAGRVTWTVTGLPWPHYFSDLSGVGGSAASSGDTVVITACPHLDGAAPAAPSASDSPSAGTTGSPPATPAASPGPSPSPSPVQLCADPELVALDV